MENNYYNNQSDFSHEQAMNDIMYREQSKSFMTKAIVALVLSSFPIGSIVAIVMGHSNRTAILDYLDRGGMHTGKIKASSIMSRAAFFLGIGLTIFYGIYFVILLFMCAALTS